MRKVYLDNLPRSKSGKTIKWEECIGKNVEFEYDDIFGVLKIIDYKSDGKHPFIKVKYGNDSKWVRTQILQLCFIGGIIGADKVVSNNRPWKYKYDIGEIVDDKVITDRKVEFDGKYHTKYYKYRCLECNFDCGEHYYNRVFHNEIWFTEGTIRSGGCSCCGGRRVVRGINSILDTNPELVKYLLHKDDAVKYSKGSHNKIYTICPFCGNIEKKRIDALVNCGFSCHSCGDGFSYPNKFMFNLLAQLNLKFETEYNPKWLNGKRFDFYIPLLKLIIEMDGGLGHGKRVMGNISPEQTLDIDNWKDNQASKHGLFVIRIDCDESDMNYIKKNILSSALSKYLDLSKINWIDCDTYAKGSIYIDIVNYYNEFNITQHTVIQYLKYANKNKLINFNPKENMRKTQFKGIKIIQFDMFTLKSICEYNSIYEAEKNTGISCSSIKRCCDRELPIAGGYIWRLKGDDDDIKDWKIESLANMHQKMVVQYDLNMNRLNIFNNMVEASIQTGVNKNSIRLCCNRIYKQAGGFIWRFIFDCKDIENKEYIYNQRTKGKTVIQYDYFYNRIATYISASEAANSVGVNPSSISECCNRKYKSIAGYIWRYEDDCEDMELKTFKIPDVFMIGQYDSYMTLINTYKNIKEAGLYTSISRFCIGNCLNNKQKTAGGFIWKRIFINQEVS